MPKRPGAFRGLPPETLRTASLAPHGFVLAIDPMVPKDGADD